MVSAHEPDFAAMETELIHRVRRIERTRRKKYQLAVGGALSLVIAGALVVAPMVLPGEDAAFAVTPTPLELYSAPGTTEESLALIFEALAESHPPPAALRDSTRLGWWVSIDGDTMSREPEPITPQLVRTTWNEDRSGSMVVSVGESYWADRPEEGVTTDDAPPAGTILRVEEFGPGEYGVPSREPAEGTVDDMRKVLAAYGLSEGESGLRTVGVTSLLLDNWTLTNEQQQSLLSLIAESGDLEVAGVTRDRLGRSVLAFRVWEAGAAYEELLLLSSETGRIIGVETMQVRDLGDIPAGSIVSYTLWEVPQ